MLTVVLSRTGQRSLIQNFVPPPQKTFNSNVSSWLHPYNFWDIIKHAHEKKTPQAYTAHAKSCIDTPAPSYTLRHDRVSRWASVARLSAIHFRGWSIRKVSCYTLLSGFRLPWPPCCCQNDQQSLWYLMRVQLKHLSPTLGSPLIASSAYRTRRLVRTKRSSGFYMQVTPFFTHHFFYTDDFTHKPFLRKTFHIDPSAQTLDRHTKAFGIQTLVHRRAFTRKRFPQRRLCTQLLEPSAGNSLHMDAFTQSLSTHRRFCTRTLLRAKALTLKHFHAISCTHKRVYTRHFYTRLHAKACAHKVF